MKFLKRFLLVILGLVAVALIAALFVKKEYALAKEITINKPKQQVYDYISLLKNQNNYGTWFKADPKMKQTYTGTDGTVGYVSAWESETMKTAMLFKGFIDFKSEASMDLKSVNDSVTNVNWTMSGSTPWPFNLMNVFMNMEDAVGKDYTQGLANLKSILEK
jgi:uncharacterized membrane protein